MISSRPRFQQLSIAAIDQSQEIQMWLSQFDDEQQQVAKMLLCHLRFVSRDEFSTWLGRAIGQLPNGEVHALYSVRKLSETQTVFWDGSGDPVARPGTSLGSEDLVYSLISNLVRTRREILFDHPSLLTLKKKRIRSYVLIDDLIGSGDRVSGFINAMLAHPTFLSWWSFGWVKIHVISFARAREAEAKIIGKIRGSDHGNRKFRKSEKLIFGSEAVYCCDRYEDRWNERYTEILDLCKNQTKIPKRRRLGYGDVMANIVFEHSVPNNLPGVLWCKNKKWNGLMSERAVPNWLLELLIGMHLAVNKRMNAAISNELLTLLVLVRRGVRSVQSLAIRLGIDLGRATSLIDHATSLGLLTPEVSLTTEGLSRLIQSRKSITLPEWDQTLYIPNSWCVGRATVQPPTIESLGVQ